MQKTFFKKVNYPPPYIFYGFMLMWHEAVKGDNSVCQLFQNAVF